MDGILKVMQDCSSLRHYFHVWAVPISPRASPHTLLCEKDYARAGKALWGSLWDCPSAYCDSGGKHAGERKWSWNLEAVWTDGSLFMLFRPAWFSSVSFWGLIRWWDPIGCTDLNSTSHFGNYRKGCKHLDTAACLWVLCRQLNAPSHPACSWEVLKESWYWGVGFNWWLRLHNHFNKGFPRVPSEHIYSVIRFIISRLISPSLTTPMAYCIKPSHSVSS